MVNLTSGIPQSTANPLLTILDGEEERRRKRAEWQAKAIDNLDQAVLDWDGFTRDKPQPPLNFAADPETAKKLGIVHSYLAIQSPTATAPEDPITRGVFRDKIAQERFAGRGVGDDLAFYGEIEKEVTGRKDAKQLSATLVETAATGALLRETSEAGIDSKSFALWREDAKGKPGYDPGLDYEYREAWNKTQADLKENLEPYLGPIKQVWNSMQSGGANWYDAYDQVPEANREAFMASLAILVRAQPAEQQPGLWEKIVKTNSRVWQTAAVDTMDFTGDQLDQEGGLLNPQFNDPGETPEQTIARQAGDAETRKRRNFIDDINAIRSESYDPVKALGFGEKVAIGIVSTVPYLASAAVPTVGTGLVYAQTERMLARDFRRDLMTGKDGIAMSDAEATALADTLAPYVAAPYAAIERLQVMGLMGKLPALEKLMAATVNKVGNKALRFTGRTVGAAAAETLQENIQQSLPAITQEMAAALSKDIPGTIWKNGKDGFFDGYWENTAVTFATMLPLSIVAGAGGIQADQRAAIFAKTPDLHLRVIGFSSESVARIRAAQQQGTFEAQLAIEAEIPNMDPRSEETKDATQELAEELQTEKEAIAAGMDNGLIPRAELGADGTWTLYDTATGQEIGTANDWEGAGRLSVAHANFKEEEDADRIAMVFSAYQAAEVSRDWNQRTGRSNEFNLDLGTGLTANQAAAESEEAFNRIAAQERAEGGDGSVARAVFGQSRTRRAKGELHTINRILQGGSVLDIFHEETHGLRREAHARGTLTRDGDIAILRAVDAVLAGKSTKEVRNDAGELVAPSARLSFLPADFDTMSQADQDTAIDEGISKIMEAEVIRTRKGGGQRQLPAGFVTRNLSAIARIAGEGTTRKFRAFIRAIRAYFGLQIDRAHQIQKALDDGTLDRATYEDYLAKLLGADEQIDLEQAARDTEARILDGLEPASAPFLKQEELENTVSLELSPEDQTTAAKELGLESWNEAATKAFATSLVDWITGVRTFSSKLVGLFEKVWAAFQRTRNALIAGTIAVSLHPEVSVPANLVATLAPTAQTAAPTARVQPITLPDIQDIGDWFNAAAKESAARGKAFLSFVEQFQSARNSSQATPSTSTEAFAQWVISNQDNNGRPFIVADKKAGTLSIFDSTGSLVKQTPALFGMTPGDAYTAEQLQLSKSQKKPADFITPAGRSEVAVAYSSAYGPVLRFFQDGKRNIAIHKTFLGKPAQRRAERLLSDSRADNRISMGCINVPAAIMEETVVPLFGEDSGAVYVLPETTAGRSLFKGFESLPANSLGPAALADLLGKDAVSRIKDPVRRVQAMSRVAREMEAARLQFERLELIAGSKRLKKSLAREAAIRTALRREELENEAWARHWQILSDDDLVKISKSDLDIAKQELREARTQATDETNVWLREQGVVQETTFGDKQEILRALGVLDGILSSVPAEIRGKIGGYTQLARIATNEAKLAFLKDRLAKVDLELEKWLKDQFDREFRALLDKAKPDKDEAGKKPRGKIGADVHELFSAIRAAMTMTGAEVEAEALALESLAASGDYTAAQESHLILEANLIRLAGDWGKADAARREAALVEATSIYNAGYMAHKTQTLQKREKRQQIRDALQQATGKDGTRQERRSRQQKDEGSKAGRALTTLFSLMSFEQVVQRAFGEDTQEARDLVDWERHAAHAKADAVQHKVDQLDDLFATLAGGKLKGEELRFAMSRPDAITVDGQTFSELEAITATLMWRQEDGQRHMTGHVDDQGAPAGDWNYTQTFIDALEAKLSQNAKAVRLHLAEQYAAEYDRLNAVFRDLNGVSLPRHKAYSPLTVKQANITAGMTEDPLTGMGMSQGFTPGSLKNRSQSAIAEPDFKDALQVYIGHAKQMEHWIAYAPFSTEAMAILNTRDLGNSVEAAAGKEALSVLRSWLDVFAQGGTRDASAHLKLNQLLGRITGRAAATALVGRVSVLAIQSTQLVAAAFEMPIASYVSRLARLFTGRLDWSGALGSDYIQRRKAQMPPVVQQAMEGLTGSKPRRLKYAVRKMGETISGADALFTAGTFAITYDYQLKQAKALGLTGAEAKAFATEAAERVTDRVAQPVRTGTRSLYEVASVSPLARISWAFASDARQKLAILAFKLAYGSKQEKARAVAVTAVLGVMATIIRAAMRDIRDDGDDDEIFDEKNWNAKRLTLSTLTAPFAGIPALGDLAEGAAFKAFDEYLPEGNMISGGIRAADTIGNLPDWARGDREGWENAIKDAESLSGGIGLGSDSAAALTSILHLARDLFGIGQNLTD